LQVLINQIEQPYARSLMVCDVPVNASEFTGSAYCGDRWKVIGEGAWLSGTGDSLENVGRIIMVIFISGYADTNGRKPATIIGWTLIIGSIVCFFTASFLPQVWGKVFFAVAQGLQGMSGVGIINEIVVRDIAAAWEGDPTSLYARRNTLGLFMGLFFFFFVIVIQWAQITEFRRVWFGILVISMSVWALLWTTFPETQAEKDRKVADKKYGFIGTMCSEIVGYKNILWANDFLRYSIFSTFFSNLWGGFLIIFGPWTMVTFGYSQLEALLIGLPSLFIGAFSAPLIPSLCKKYGHRSVVMGCFWYEMILEWGFIPFLTRSVGPIPVPHLVGWLKTPCGGIGSIYEAVGAKVVDPGLGAKLAAMYQLMGFSTGAMSALIYTRCFYWEATNQWQRLAPFIVASCLKLFSQLIFYNGHRHIVLRECKNFEEMHKEEEAKKAEGKEGTEGDKKEDAKQDAKEDAKEDAKDDSTEEAQETLKERKKGSRADDATEERKEETKEETKEDKKTM